MEREQKHQEVALLKGTFSSAKSAVVLDFKGLTVVKDTSFRKSIRESKAHYRVSKNTLLKLAVKQPNASSHVRRLLAVVVTGEGRTPGEQPLIEPLSERELEVLRLLESDLDGPGMARELTVSLATVRTHTRNIYAKLGVNSRRAAVRRAGELGLLSRTRDGRTTA